MPGFGFSDKPAKAGWGFVRIADARIKLVVRIACRRWALRGRRHRRHDRAQGAAGSHRVGRRRGLGGTTPSRDMLVRGAAPAGATGTVFGFVYSGLDLGSAMTPPFGLLLDHHMPRLIFVFTAGILLLAISTAFVVGHRKAERRGGLAGGLVRSTS